MVRHRIYSLLLGTAAFVVATPARAGSIGGMTPADALRWTGIDATEFTEGEAAEVRLRSARHAETYFCVGTRLARFDTTTAFEAFAELQFPLERVPPAMLGAKHGVLPARESRDELHPGAWLAPPPFASTSVGAEIAAPSRLRESAASPEHNLASLLSGGPAATEPDSEPAADSIPVTVAEGPGSRAAPAARPIPPSLTPELARACVRAAWRAAGLADDGKLESLSARARASAALPELRLRVARVTDESGRLTYLDDPETPHYATAGSATYWLEARLAFRLDRLLFADEEVQIERLRIERNEARARLTVRVLKALGEWQRALALQQRAETSAAELLSAELAAIEAAATLNVLTDGWFERSLPQIDRTGEQRANTTTREPSGRAGTSAP